ncbi:hypothetical protein Ddye_001153 [Dipteronia dyeriana]|uniref:RNase H type-1 domain-containing protein n=1 Tax=Dipteronia dyeriana TaxID=168575 RepID=A0AAD9XMY6_9ROSI|nr:hypothetical protein Ddye_001153 [Dipteronia dyeriana]
MHVRSVGNFWRSSEVGFFKINYNNVVYSRRGRIGIGIVVQDASGFIMASCFHVMEATFDVQLAKTAAIYKGIIFGGDCGLALYVIEFDAEVVVNWINSGNHLNSVCDIILTDFSSLMSCSDGMTINHVSRLTNQVAHKLAKNALLIAEDIYWI